MQSLYNPLFRLHRNGLCYKLSELCYKGTIIRRYNRKMTILWPFSYNSFLKFHWEKCFGSHSVTYIQSSVIMRCVIKGLHYI